MSILSQLKKNKIQSSCFYRKAIKLVLTLASHMCNIEKWYRWTYLQGKNRDADVDNKLWSQAKGVGRVNLEIMINIYTLPLIAQSVKRLPEVQETWIQFLDWKDPLEKEMATHSSIRAWRIPWTEETGRLQSVASQESDTTEWLSTHTHTHYHV